MSHFVSIKTQIKDAQALRLACQELGLEILENATARGYGTQTLKADLVIRLKGPYDIACQKQADGSYSLTTDWYRGHVEQQVGSNYGLLLQRYAINRATLEARRKGYTTRRVNLPNGSIKLQVTVT